MLVLPATIHSQLTTLRLLSGKLKNSFPNFLKISVIILPACINTFFWCSFSAHFSTISSIDIPPFSELRFELFLMNTTSPSSFIVAIIFIPSSFSLISVILPPNRSCTNSISSCPVKSV